jgi:processive 1,2-diacylglycerol beta-glucosyltransferase
MMDVQIIAVAGRNLRLESKLKSLDTINKLVVYGFINNIHELMEVSDCIITKPGGVTTAEILCKQKPLVIFSPLPGQENENAEFLLNSGAAVATSDVNKIPVLINQIFSSQTRLRCFRDMTGELKKPDASAKLVKFLTAKYEA